jgi:DNA polymerase III subunit epsilon
MAREIILDTETTGMDPNRGDRVIELCALEMVGGVLTGAAFHKLIHPERDIPIEATNVHGLTLDDLAGKPLFGEIADSFLAFMGDSPMVAHNASFDVNFLNWELRNVGRPTIPQSKVIDTLAIARQKFPGARLSLDALCNRFAIDLSARTKHSALIDTKLLADVYIELLGGKQRSLGLAAEDAAATSAPMQALDRPYRAPRAHSASAAELEAHSSFVGKLKDALWQKLSS